MQVVGASLLLHLLFYTGIFSPPVRVSRWPLHSLVLVIDGQESYSQWY